MTSLEIQTYVGRADASRTVLDELLAVLGDDHLGLRGPGDAWDVATHLGHLATSDLPLMLMLGDISAGSAPPRSLPADRYLRGRDEQIASASQLTLVDLRGRLAETRQQLVASLVRLNPAALESELQFATPAGTTVGVSLRSYLCTWAAHDIGHTAALRTAIASAPSPAALAAAARLAPKREVRH